MEKVVIEYGNVIQSDQDCQYIEPNYNVIAFSTESKHNISIPVLYFIPKSTILHTELSNVNHGFYRCPYGGSEEEKKNGINTDTIGSELESWLSSNCDHMIQLDKFVCASDQPIFRNSSTFIIK